MLAANSDMLIQPRAFIVEMQITDLPYGTATGKDASARRSAPPFDTV